MSISLFAQATSGELTGTIYDASGATVPNASVVAKSATTGVETTTKAGGNGEYRLSNLLVGNYTLSVTANGFTKTELNNLRVDLNKISTANVTLQVGSTTTSVDVAAAGATIDTTTAQIQNSFDATAASNLPQAANGAGVLNLSLLNAGVSSTGGIGSGTGPSVGGQRPANNSFTIEGVDNNSKDVTGPVLFVPNDAVGDFSVLQNNYSPEFGGSSGGQFNTVIKSGTNQYHGTLYEYFQNRNLNAVDATYTQQGLTSNPRYDQNRVGANVGGPIWRNKAFFFADAEYNPIGQSSTPGGAIQSPTAAGYAALAANPGVSPTNLGILQKYVPAASAATDSTTVAGQAIPIGPISVVAPNFSNQYNIVVAGDVNFSDKDQLRVRYLYNKFDGIDNAAALPAFFSTIPNYLHLGSIAEYHTFSPTLTNEFRASYNRKFNNYPIPDDQFPGLDQFPNIFIQNDLNLQLGPDPNAPQGYIQNNYQLQDNVTKVAGAHTLKFGYVFNDVIASNTFIQRSRGDYEYSTLDGYLRDLSPDVLGERSVGASGGIPVGFASHGVFVNDDWKIRPNLTLNLGVRYEYVEVPVVSRAQRFSSVADVPGVLTFRSPESQTKNWAPRIGIAYSPGTSGTTSIRAGFGMAYDQFYNNLSINSKPAFYQNTVDVDVNNNTPNFLAGGGIGGTVPPPTTDPVLARNAIGSYTYDQVRPYSINWTFGIQHIFARNYTFEARYVGSRGVHQYVQEQLNRSSVVNASNFIPTYTTAPSAAQLGSLRTTLGDLEALSNNPLEQYGFTSIITGYHPIGNSSYHGLNLQLNRRYSNGLSLVGAYTWSHNIDDSTATVFSTYLTPRRGQDFGDLRADRSSSALDRRHRFTLNTNYDWQPFKDHNWFLKNLVGNWNISGTYTFESPEYATIQAGTDSNLNGDTAGDRTILNPTGVGQTGTGVTAYDGTGQVVDSGSSSIVAYVANNPNAKYILAEQGARGTSGRNTFPLDRIDNLDAALYKRFNVTERMHLDIGAQFYNILNHAQFTGGSLNDVTPVGFVDTRNFLLPGNTDFGRYDQFLSSNSRRLQLTAKFYF